MTNGWKHQYSEGKTMLPVPRVEVVLFRPEDAECPNVRVWPAAEVLEIFRFRSADDVDFDIDLRELRGQERLDLSCGFLQEIGRRLGKPVLLADRWSGDRGSRPGFVEGSVAEHRELDAGRRARQSRA
ncbi:hypothetical protein ACFV60_11595 [Streptomyces virginiae]|uniref:hypothetical protein n=1 Tax=Streptomyces virginiae TaxID=1961 RepID=UPI003659025C